MRAPWAAVLLLCGHATAERLPIRAWTSLDGLAHDHINAITTDSRGWLWFSTDEGLSRFDGTRFRTYRVADGLPHPHVNTLIEAADGTLWLGTDGGVCRFLPKSNRSHFEVFRLPGRREANNVNALLFGADGTLWAGTSAGLFQARWRGATPDWREVAFGAPAGQFEADLVTSIVADAETLWVGAKSGLYRLSRDGRAVRITADFINCLRRDPLGDLWVGTREHGIYRIRQGAVDSRVEGLPVDVRSMYFDPAGELWAGTIGGLCRIADGRARCFGEPHGLTAPEIYAIAVDVAGNFWLGTYHSGIMRLSRDGFVSYGAVDGLAGVDIGGLLRHEGPDPVLMSGRSGAVEFHAFQGEAAFRSLRSPFRAVLPALPAGAASGHGEWWLTTCSGVLEIASAMTGPVRKLSGAPAERCSIVTARARDGALWQTQLGAAGLELVRLRPGASTADPGAAALETTHTSALRVEPTALLVEGDTAWIGLVADHGILRVRGAHESTIKLPPDAGAVRALHLDRTGRLWAATDAGGVAQIEDASGDNPRPRQFGRAQGLSSDEARTIVEDNSGNVYVGTGGGVDRIDTAGGIRRFTTADGLVPGAVRDSWRAADGSLWFVTHQGVSRLLPAPARRSLAPALWIEHLTIGGRPYAISELGERRIRGLEIAAEDSDLRVEFASLELAAARPPQYQYQLDSASWSAEQEEPVVQLAGLASGSYRLAFRVAGDSQSEPVLLEFTVLAPWWRKPWMLAVWMGIAMAGTYTVHRQRLKRAVDLERLRTRLASDLHDDLGAGLTEIALLSETGGQLERIGRRSRELRESMAEIVWSVDPARDRLGELLRRMRDTALSMLETEHREVVFEAKDEAAADAIPLTPAFRRHLFLLFKEAVSNASRHSQASRVTIRVQRQAGALEIEVSDNGRGFDVSAPAAGMGLRNMRRRAQRDRRRFTYRVQTRWNSRALAGAV